MLRNERGSSSLAVGIVAAVVGVLIGFGVASLLTPKDQTPVTTAPAPDTGTKAADLRVKLDSLLEEHSQLAAASGAAIIAGLPESASVGDQLDKNSNDLADVFGTYYGDAARQSFYTSWKDHITKMSDYATAAKKNDKAGMATATTALTASAQTLATLLAGLNPQFSAADLNTSLADHETQLKGIIDSYAAKDYAKAFTGERTAAAHMVTLGDYLASGIVKQFQSKF